MYSRAEASRSWPKSVEVTLAGEGEQRLGAARPPRSPAPASRGRAAGPATVTRSTSSPEQPRHDERGAAARALSTTSATNAPAPRRGSGRAKKREHGAVVGDRPARARGCASRRRPARPARRRRRWRSRSAREPRRRGRRRRGRRPARAAGPAGRGSRSRQVAAEVASEVRHGSPPPCVHRAGDHAAVGRARRPAGPRACPRRRPGRRRAARPGRRGAATAARRW